MTWNPQQYLLFAGHRLRPALDLLGRIGAESPGTVVDLGCGAGNVTRLLRERWPAARVVGYDNSPEMLERAATDTSVEWRLADLDGWTPEAPVDVVFSNAALHWLGDHPRLFGRLADAVAPGGWLAVQMPNNWRAPSHVSAVATVRAGPWRDRLAGLLVTDPLLPSEGYYDLLAPRAKHLDMWETEYLQVLEGENPVVEWTKGTILAPLLTALDPAERAAFEADYARRVRQAYPPRPDGRTLFPFRRLFIVAQF